MEKERTLSLDYTNLMADAIGPEHGLTQEELKSLLPQVRELIKRVKAKPYPFMELPFQTEGLKELKSYAQEVAQRFENFILLGIGGSCLGNIALHSALSHPFYNLLPREQRDFRPRMFFIDNVDPDLMSSLLEVVDLKKSIINVITKSGTTPETMSNYFILKEKLLEQVAPKTYKDHVVVITDEHKGPLRQIAIQEGHKCFFIPEGVGGRYSVLSPAGLLSAAIEGINVEELLAGARHAHSLCQKEEIGENLAMLLSLLLFLSHTRKDSGNLVIMPYSYKLRDVADWLRQLWAESLGKKHSSDGKVVHSGQTPIKALGTTDQHSQLQLYMEGPFDKVILFLTVARFEQEVPIPAHLAKATEKLEYLSGHSLNQLMKAEHQATAQALSESQRPNCTLSLPAISPFTLGQLLFLCEVQTAYSGLLYNVNAFDQPGVELGKVYARDFLRKT